ncbi:MAG: hypothetical protein MUE67_01890 [Anaerolineales bacterium]|nr:hypothetical protein [Anaerolineales bacterium]
MENQLAVFSLEIGAAVLFWLVFVVIETAVYQLLNWGTFQTCLRAAFLVNLASALLIAAGLMSMQRLGWPGVTGSVLIAVLLEGLILNRLKPGARQLNWLVSILANLASFLILILPVFFFTRL